MKDPLFYKEYLVKAMNDSFENDIYIANLEDKYKRNSIKRIIWIMLLCFFSPMNYSDDEELYFIYTKIQDEVWKDIYQKNKVYAGKYLSNCKKIKSHCTFFSDLNRLERFQRIYRALLFYFINRNSISCSLGLSIEYYSIYEFIMKSSCKEIFCAGHYDRYITFISEIAILKGARIVGSQHGAIAINNLPNKIFFNEFRCFSYDEMCKAKEFIKNEDCKYVCKGFSSHVVWNNFEIDKRYKAIIAIASQDKHFWNTIELINYLVPNMDESIFWVVYPHYRENISDYYRYIPQYSNLVISKIERHKNIDILITFYSTIVYDFWSVNSDINVICLKIPGFDVAYYKKQNVVLCDSYEEIKRSILRIEEENK